MHSWKSVLAVRRERIEDVRSECVAAEDLEAVQLREAGNDVLHVLPVDLKALPIGSRSGALYAEGNPVDSPVIFRFAGRYQEAYPKGCEAFRIVLPANVKREIVYSALHMSFWHFFG